MGELLGERRREIEKEIEREKGELNRCANEYELSVIPKEI